MKTPEFIQMKLCNRTEALNSSYEVENNRYVYILNFSDKIGFDWLERQVEKASDECGRQLELWKFGTSMEPYTYVEVREVNRRERIDEDQNSLEDFT